MDIESFVNGRWVRPAGDAAVELTDPNTGAPRAQLVDSSHEQINEAIDAARRGTWSDASLDGRLAALQAAAAAVDAVADEIAEMDAVETGVPLFITRQIEQGLRPAAMSFLDSAHAFLKREGSHTIPGRYGHPIVCYREAISPAVIVAPWNVPCGTIVPKLFVALLCGCSVIVKPSEHASRGILRMLRAMLEASPTLASVLQVVVGGPAVGSQLVGSPHVGCVQFTGATPTASKIAVACASNLRPFLAECGGSNTAILLEDADLDLAVPAIAMGMTTLNGQWCMGISRVLVHEAIKIDFIQRFASYCNDHIRVVPSMPLVEPSTGEELLIGPMAFAAHADLLRSCAASVGGRMIPLGAMSASLASQPAFAQPAMILDPGHDIAHLELFGPIIGVLSFSDVQEAIALSNSATGQLAAYLFSQNVDGLYGVASQIKTGMVMFNSVNFCFEAAEGHSEPMADFVGTAGHGSDGNGEALATFFSSRRWCGVNGPQK